MSDQQLLERIACDPKVMVGKPVIKGTRLTVEYILNLLAHGSSATDILDEYDGTRTGRHSGLFALCVAIVVQHGIYATGRGVGVNAIPRR